MKRDLEFQQPYQIVESENILCLQAFNLAPKMGHPRPATHSYFVECRQVGKQLCYFEQNMLFLVKLNPEFSS